MTDYQLLNKMTSWMPWTRSGKRSSIEDHEEPSLLLSLIHPDVTHALLDTLDPKSLLILRLVCKRTKSWVDHPKYLSQLRIALHTGAGSKKMRKVVKAKTDFCNFKIGFEKRNNDDLIAEFGQRFGSFLKILDINTMTFHPVALSLLRHCPSLESLTLLGLNLSKVTAAAIDDLKGISSVLSNLKFLSIGNILFIDAKEMEYFQSLLQLCNSLLSLRLPFINFQSKSEKESRNEIMAKYVINPVIKSIQDRGQGSHSQSNLKYLILEYINPALPPDLFLKLVTTCYEYKTILHNVHESHLKCSKPDRVEVETESQKVQEMIGTLDGLNGNIQLGRLINLKCISIWVSSALKLTETNLVNSTLPKLKNINLFMDTAEEDLKINRLLASILEVERPTVSSLKISYNSRSGAISADLVKAVDITKNFQHLRKLDIYQWDAFDEEFLILWKGLGAHRIQDLSLLLCTNLSDRGLLGDDPNNAAILNLTGLKELHVSSLYGSISDASMKAFRFMMLQKLRLYSQSVTYDGIASLLGGELYKTIEYIHCSKPLDCTQKEFYYLVKDILDAKSYPELLREKPVRRRSQPLVMFEPSDDD